MKHVGEIRVRLSADGKLLGPPAQSKRVREALAEGKLKRICATFVPCVVGGTSSPTLLGVPGDSLLEASVKLCLERTRRKGTEFEAVYTVVGRGKFASAPPRASLQ